MESKNKVAIINNLIFGSTGKIANGLYNYFINNGTEVYLCYGRGKKKSDKNFYRIDYPFESYIHMGLTRLFGKQGEYSYFATKRLINFFIEKDINCIYIVNLHGYYLNEKLFFNYLINKQIKVVYLMIDEYAFKGKCGYSGDCDNYLSECGNCPKKRDYPSSWFFDRSRQIFYEKMNAYNLLNRVMFVGPKFVIDNAKKSPLLKGKRIQILDEAVDIKFYAPCDNRKIRQELSIGEDKILILCVAPYSQERKGGRFFMEAAERLKNDDRFSFMYIGFDVKQNHPENVITFGFEYDQDRLRQYYSMADLFVFPSLLDTMPNVCLEVMAAGTPLLCFDISGMPYIAPSEIMTLVEAENVDQMVEVIKKTKKKSKEVVSRCRDYAVNRYDREKYFSKLEEYLKLL